MRTRIVLTALAIASSSLWVFGGAATAEGFASRVPVVQDEPDEVPVVTASISPHQLDSSGGPVEITATARDDHGIDSIYAVIDEVNGAQFVQTLHTVAGDQYAGTWTAPPNQSHDELLYTVTVVATDASGQEGLANAGQTTVAAAPDPDPDTDDPPVIDMASLSTYTLPPEGGVIDLLVAANDDRGISEVRAEVQFTGETTPRLVTLLPNGGMYGGSVQLPSNSTAADVVYGFAVTVADTGGHTTSVDLGNVTVAHEPGPVQPSWLGVSCRVVRFFSTDRGERAMATITVSNPGPTEIVSGWLGEVRAPFRVVGGTKPFTLGPGQRLAVRVVFRGWEPGVHRDRLEIARDDDLQPRLGVRLVGRLRP